jgi:hypothetical protein
MVVIPIYPVKAAPPPLMEWSTNGDASYVTNDGDIREQGGYSRENASLLSYFATDCPPANCGTRLVRVYYVEWNITEFWNVTGIPFNLTVVGVRFKYNSERHDAGTYGIVKGLLRANDSVRTRPHTASDEDLFNAIFAGREYQTRPNPDFPELGANKTENLLREVSGDFSIMRRQAIEANSTNDYFAIGVHLNVTYGPDPLEIGFVGSDTVPPADPVPTLNLLYYEGVYCFPSGAEIENSYEGGYITTGNDLIIVEYTWYRFRLTYENWNVTAERPPLYIAFSPDRNETWINITMSVGIEYTGDVDISKTYANLSVTQNMSYVSVPDRIANLTKLEDTQEDYYNIIWDESTWQLNVTFWIWFNDIVPDQTDIELYADCGLERWDYMLSFDIYNLGGFTENCGAGPEQIAVAGADAFEMMQGYGGISCKRQYFRKIQSLTWQFAVQFFDNETGLWIPEDQYMQDGSHQGGGEKASNPGDWFLDLRIMFWDESVPQWTQLINTRLWMEEGDEGADDEWIWIKTAYFDHNGEVVVNDTSNQWYALIEEEGNGWFRLWWDTWISRDNGSSVVGTRTSAYYYAMQRVSNGWGLWEALGGNPWVPMKRNETEAMAFQAIKRDDNTTIPSSALDMMIIQLSIERSSNKIGEMEFRVGTVNFNEKNIRTMSRADVLTGIDTPNFEDTKVADMPSTGPLRQLIDAIMGLPMLIYRELAAIGLVLWEQMAIYFPWLTNIIESAMVILVPAAEFGFTIMEYLASLLTWGLDLVYLIATPITIIVGTYDLLVTYTADFIGVNPVEVSNFLVIVMFIVPMIEAIQRGDTSYVLNTAKMIWGVASTILSFVWNIGAKVIGWIIEAFPL